MRAVKRVTMEMTTSVAESIPSPNTAKLPEKRPMLIFKVDKIALPIMLTHEARIKILSLSFILLFGISYCLYEAFCTYFTLSFVEQGTKIRVFMDFLYIFVRSSILKNKVKDMVIAVDFDGTIVEHCYPEIGKEVPFAVDTLKMLQRDRHKLIMWTVREGELLDEAVEWCKERGLEFYAVNKDYPEEKVEDEGFSRKLKVDMFIDDRNLGGLPDWGIIYRIIKEKSSFEEVYSEVSEQPIAKKKRWWSK